MFLMGACARNKPCLTISSSHCRDCQLLTQNGDPILCKIDGSFLCVWLFLTRRSITWVTVTKKSWTLIFSDCRSNATYFGTDFTSVKFARRIFFCFSCKWLTTISKSLSKTVNRLKGRLVPPGKLTIVDISTSTVGEICRKGGGVVRDQLTWPACVTSLACIQGKVG